MQYCSSATSTLVNENTISDGQQQDECRNGGYVRLESNQSCLSEEEVDEEAGSLEEDAMEGFDDEIFCEEESTSYESRAPLSEYE